MKRKKKQKKKVSKAKQIVPKTKSSKADVQMKGSFKGKWSSTKSVYTRPR